MKTKVLRVILFFLVILIIPAFTLFGEKESISYNENRTLAQFPELTVESWKNRSFMTGMADYFSDHFVLRENFIKLKNKIEILIGKDEINGVFEYDGYLIQTFKDIDYKLTDRNIASLNKLKSKFNDIPFYFMPVITSQEKFKENLPDYLNLESETDYINYCFSKLKNIEKIDVSREICETDYAFYRTDHHWTTDAAYRAYLKTATHLEIKPVEAVEIKTVSNDFYGTLYSRTLNEKIEADYIGAYVSDTRFNLCIKDEIYDSLYFDNFLKEKDKYSYFLSGNHGISTIKNLDITSDKKIMVIKDSYANCFVPFLAENYSEVTLIDPRYSSYAQIKEINPSDYDDVLVLFNVSGFSQEQNFALIEFMGDK